MDSPPTGFLEAWWRFGLSTLYYIVNHFYTCWIHLLCENAKVTTNSLLHCTNNTLLMHIGKYYALFFFHPSCITNNKERNVPVGTDLIYVLYHHCWHLRTKICEVCAHYINTQKITKDYGGIYSCCDARILSKSEAAAMRMCKQQPGMRRRLRAHARAGTYGLPTAQNWSISPYLT